LHKSVWIERLPRGYSVRRRGAPREWVSTYQEAQKRKLELRSKLIAEKQGQSDPTLKLRDTFYSYLDWCERHEYRPSTLRFKKDHMRDFVSFKLKLSEITEASLQAYNIRLTASKLSATTIKIRLTEIRAFLNWCVKQKLLDVSPFSLEIRAVDTNRQKIEGEILKGIERHLDKCFRLFYYLICDHGTRRTETLMAQKEHFDLSKKTWFIPASNTKGKYDRTIPLSDRACNEVAAYPPGPLFPGWQSTTPRWYLGKARKALEKELGKPVPRIFPHLFRHTRASNWQGNPYAMMEFMGWKSWQMAKRYSHHNVEDLRREANK
jgi:integrase